MKRHHFVALVVFDIGVIILFVIFLKYAPRALLRPPNRPVPPEETFRQYVLNPIPKSVKNIRADQPKNFGGYRYTFRFNINRGDLALLTDSRPFVRIWNVKYQEGDIWWTWDQDGPFGLIMHTTNAIC